MSDQIKVPPNWNEDHPDALYKTLLIPAFGATCSWWDLDEDEVVLGYTAFREGIRAKTRLVYAFITRDIDGQYHLYVVH